MFEVPEMLKPFDKFANNEALCKDWEKLMTMWLLVYPLVNIKDQLGYAHVWLLANPRKDKKLYGRYLNNWFRGAQERAKERGGLKAPSLPKPKQYQETEDTMTGSDFAKMREVLHEKRKGKDRRSVQTERVQDDIGTSATGNVGIQDDFTLF